MYCGIGVADGDPPLGTLATEAGHAVGETRQLLRSQRLQRLRVEVDDRAVLGRTGFDKNMRDGHCGRKDTVFSV